MSFIVSRVWVTGCTNVKRVEALVRLDLGGLVHGKCAMHATAISNGKCRFVQTSAWLATHGSRPGEGEWCGHPSGASARRVAPLYCC